MPSGRVGRCCARIGTRPTPDPGAAARWLPKQGVPDNSSSREPKMSSTFRALSHGAVAVAALGIAAGACAQSSQSSLAREIGDSRPQAGKSFIDLSVGKSSYNTACGNVAGLTCSRGTTSYSLTAGNMVTDNVGIELSAMNFGKADRAGGSVIARGVNLSAVGRLPLGDVFGLEAKVGPTYGVTHVDVPADSGLA